MISLVFDLEPGPFSVSQERVVGKVLVNDRRLEDLFHDVTSDKISKYRGILKALLNFTPFKRLYYITFDQAAAIYFTETGIMVDSRPLSMAKHFTYLPVFKTDENNIFTIRLIKESK